MQSFIKRETLIKSICLMGLMAAINVIFSLLTNFVPFLGVALVIFLPLTSAIVEISCKDRYFPIYAFATIGLSIVVSLSAIDVTIFYVVPSIITGYLFGLMSKRHLPDFIAIFAASCAQAALSYLFVPLMELITERNILDDIVRIFSIDDRLYFDSFILLIFFLVGLIQTILSFIVVNNELTRLGAKEEDKNDYSFVANLACLISIILLIIFAFILLSVSYVCLGFAWYFAAFSVFFAIKKKQKLLFALMVGSLFINVILFAILNGLMPEYTKLLLLGIAPTLCSGLSLAFYFLKKQKC